MTTQGHVVGRLLERTQALDAEAAPSRSADRVVSEERARTLGGLTDHPDQLRLSWAAFETESLGYAGTEIIRGIIGFAHLTDLTALEDPVAASRRALLIGRELILNRRELTDVESVRAVVQAT